MTIDITARSRAVGIGVEFKNFESGQVLNLPQRVALIGQGNTASTYSLDKFQITSAAEAANKYGFGSPIHLSALQLFPANGDGIGSIPVTVYPMDDDGSGVVAAGDITASGTQTEDQVYAIKVNKISSGEFVIAKDITASAAITQMKSKIDSVLEMPIDTGANTGVELVLDLTSKWKGESANDIFVEIEGVEAGITFTVTQLVGGAVNPDIDTPLGKIGVAWETIILNCLNYDDTDTLDKISTFGEGRWGDLEKKPLFSIFGTGDNRTTRTAITDVRKTDRTNALIPAPGSNNLPFVIAARAVARIAVTANNDPPQNYKGRLTGLVPGADDQQENYLQRDTSLKAGSGTTILVDGEIELNDTITFYHPDGDQNPPYRYVVDIVRLQNVVYNIGLIFESSEWKGAALLPDSTPTVSTTAKKPKDALTSLGNLADGLGLKAIISEPSFTQANQTATINDQNPKRLNINYPIKLSGNTEITSIDLFFGFFFGSLT